MSQTKKLFSKTKIFIILLIIVVPIIVGGYYIPERLIIPVRNAAVADWNHETFWHHPWGQSGVHKGIDIFGYPGKSVISASDGIVLFRGKLERGGTVVLVLGPKWRFHYYAHLKNDTTHWGKQLKMGQPIGTMGNTGNAQGKPTHLHYSIFTPIPYLWQWDDSPQGWLKPFFINPTEVLLPKQPEVDNQIIPAS